jgi:PhzF family phenazine biosynthesis protein
MKKPQTISLYQVDAFTRMAFTGNPAAVCLLSDPLDDAVMQAIAAEMNLSETAFVMRLDDAPWSKATTFSLRWFTPTVEVRLCGHATLATAAVLFGSVDVKAASVTFQTLSGDLVARCERDATANALNIVLDFPLDTPVVCDPPASVLAAIGVTQVEAAVYGASTCDLLVHLADARQLRDLQPNFAAMMACEGMDSYRGLMVTAAGDPPYDFVSRFFAPWVGIDEDPVTGSAHTLLAPYWAARLGKREMRAYQASARGGEVGVRLIDGGRVELTGDAVVVFEGYLYL